jgi:hypothetical protein
MTKMTVIGTCYEVVPKLAELKVTTPEGSHKMDAASMEAVLTIMDGLPRAVFTMLDEKPGTFGYEWDGEEWHYKLRQVRNTPEFGKRLFAGFV